MIITQVEELKRLVNEFSNFARMPAANPAPSDINEIINEALSLYRETHKEVDFVFNDLKEVPVFNLDREQIRRVMINLFDNAIEAIEGKGGDVCVTAPRWRELGAKRNEYQLPRALGVFDDQLQ